MSQGENLSLTQFGDHIPPPPGESPLPEGHDRYYHQTNPENIPSIKEHGLLWDKGRGYEGPKGVWISNKPFYKQSGLGMVELALPHNPARENITSVGDIHPDQFLAIHEPWHEKVRYIEGHPDILKATLSGQHDALLDEHDYGPAIRHLKRKYGAE